MTVLIVLAIWFGVPILAATVVYLFGGAPERLHTRRERQRGAGEEGYARVIPFPASGRHVDARPAAPAADSRSCQRGVKHCDEAPDANKERI